MAGGGPVFTFRRLFKRFVLTYIFLFLVYNPTGTSALDVLRNQNILLLYRFTLASIILTLLIALARITWTSIRFAGVVVAVLLIAATMSLLWYLQEWVKLNESTRYFASLMVVTSAFTFGEIIPMILLHMSGQKPAIKYPP